MEEAPAHGVRVNGFSIDLRLVTNRQFTAFVATPSAVRYKNWKIYYNILGLGGALGGPVTAFLYDWNRLWEKKLLSYQTFPPMQAPETYNLVGILDAMRKGGHPSD